MADDRKRVTNVARFFIYYPKRTRESSHNRAKADTVTGDSLRNRVFLTEIS